MKKIMLYLLIILPGCNSISYKKHTSSFITLGSNNALQTWIYLCGLTNHFSPQQMNDLHTLDTIGKELNITILAIIPKHRCSKYNNHLCWPHGNKNEILNTYKEITETIDAHKINGYIGFSNGGFFLIQLAQYISLHTPIITIGAAGKINNPQGPYNKIQLLIGDKDEWHYEPATELYKESHNTNLTIDLITYQGKHEIPIDPLKNLLKNQ